MKIVADDKIPFLRGVLEPYADIIYLPGKEIIRDVILDADALLIRTRTKCNQELLDGTKVRFIGTATIGFDHIDTHFCERRNITWTNAPGCNSTSVQQYITAALLKLSSNHQIDLTGKTIGIIGVGNVGTKVEKAARVLGLNVMLCDPPRARQEGSKNFVLLGDILYNADIITCHVPLNIVGDDKTYHLFDEKTFKKMKKGSWFINSSRGEVAETSSLKKVVESGKIGAILDVWENEPDIDLDLMSGAFIATPHIAGYSTDGKANGTAMVVNSLCRFFGLSLGEWYPADVPAPANPSMRINPTGLTDNEIIHNAVYHTYNIEDDDLRLRFSPSDFEKLRGDYPLRREFTSYEVMLSPTTGSVRKKLTDLGFRVSS